MKTLLRLLSDQSEVFERLQAARAPKPKSSTRKPAVEAQIVDTSDFKHLIGKTIKETAINLLCHVAIEEEAGTVGLPYKLVMDIIRTEFPKSSTSVSCLRWYAVQIRNSERGYEGLTMPHRRMRN